MGSVKEFEKTGNAGDGRFPSTAGENPKGLKPKYGKGAGIPNLKEQKLFEK